MTPQTVVVTASHNSELAKMALVLLGYFVVFSISAVIIVLKLSSKPPTR